MQHGPDFSGGLDGQAFDSDVLRGDVLDGEVLALAFAAGGDALMVLAPDGAVLAANAAGRALLDAATPAQTWVDLWSGKDRAAALAALAAAGRGEAGTVQGVLTDPGGLTWWSSTLRRVPAGTGAGEEGARVLAVSRDMTGQRRAERALERAERLHQALTEATAEITWHLDLATGVTLRRGYVEFTGEQDDADDIDGWLEGVHPDDRAGAKQVTDQALGTRLPLTIDYRLRHRTQGWRWVEDRAVPILADDGTLTDWVGIITDIHDRRSGEAALRRSEERLRLALETAALAPWDIDMVTGERDWSAEAMAMFGMPPDTPPVEGTMMDYVLAEDRALVREQYRRSALAAAGDATASEFRIIHGVTGQTRWIAARGRIMRGADGRTIRHTGTFEDRTERKQAEHAVWLAAHADALTGVANRTLFQSRLDAAVEHAMAAAAGVALLIVDLDRFKEVNDTLGHDAGDLLLRTVARRLQDGVPAEATVARLGGDEFAVLLPTRACGADTGALAAALLAGLRRPLDYGGREIDVSASIGWSVYPDHDAVPSNLLKNADMALYAVKSAGRGHALPFTPAMRDEMERRVTVLRWAKEALLRDAVLPFYQPKVSLETGQVAGFEALLRWTDGTGLRMPGAIGEALDEPELAGRLGARMRERVMADMRRWAEEGTPFGHVAINVAAAEFQGQCYAGAVLTALREAGLKPGQLEVEVTERVLLDDTRAIGHALGELHRAGVAIALDDFGTGYASLTHLKAFPVSWIKIDRSFISTLAQDGDSEAIVRAVIGLGHSIGIRIVGEGVETGEQLAFLSGTGCDLAQGYLLAKPMAASRVPMFLKTWTMPAASAFPLRPAAMGR